MRQGDGGGDRNNNNRLLDTNHLGNGPTSGDHNAQADNLKYMVGSELTIKWTSQDSCGGPNQCDIIIQTM